MKLSFITHVFLILFLIFLNNLNSQSKQTYSISGVVLDDDTGEPIPTVNVFLDGTTLGTSTDKNGEYKINYIPTGSYKIIASMIGYEKKGLVISLVAMQTIEINFQLVPYSYELDEISITTERDYDWIDDAERFQNQILGTSINSRDCEIVNREVLKFSNSDDVRLMAEASEPLEIMNNALGYKIIFDLVEFRLFNNNDVNYYGYIRFEELIPED